MRTKNVANGSNLFSLHEPSSHSPCHGADNKRRRNSERKMSPEAVNCLIQEFFAGIATLLHRMLYDSHTISDCIGNRASCARSLVS